MKTAKIAAALSAALLTGCAMDARLQELREMPSFHVGYGDGCLTASEEDKSFSTKKARDAYAFKNDDAYRAGWRQGYLECASRTAKANDGGRILGERKDY